MRADVLELTLYRQVGAEGLEPGDGRGEAIAAGIERVLVIVVGVVDADCCPAVRGDVVVEVREGRELGIAWQIDDAWSAYRSRLRR